MDIKANATRRIRKAHEQSKRNRRREPTIDSARTLRDCGLSFCPNVRLTLMNTNPVWSVLYYAGFLEQRTSARSGAGRQFGQVRQRPCGAAEMENARRKSGLRVGRNSRQRRGPVSNLHRPERTGVQVQLSEPEVSLQTWVGSIPDCRPTTERLGGQGAAGLGRRMAGQTGATGREKSR